MTRMPLLLVLCLALVGCVQTGASSPSQTALVGPTGTPEPTAPEPTAPEPTTPEPTAAPDTTHLADAAAFMPPGAQQLFFTDWSAIKRAIGAEDVTSESPIEERVAVSVATARSEAAASAFGLRHLRSHADLWGFDTMDLEWEATVRESRGFSTWILRFRERFDLTSVARRFDERDFSTEQLEGAVLRSHDMDLSQEWIRGSELAISNTAFLADGRTLVASSDPDAVRAVVAEVVDQGAKTLPALAVIGLLENASGAILLSATDTCDALAPLGLEPDTSERAEQELTAAGPLSRYSALGLGYSTGWDPAGRIVFAYGDADAATGDLPGRRALAETGHSLRTGRPYAESVFAVADAVAADGTILLEVEPAADMPRRLFEMVFARDMLFAACTD